MQPEVYKNHVIFEKLEQFGAVLNSEKENIEKLTLENFDFYRTCYSYLKDRLKLTIPVLISETDLVNLSNEIEAGTSQINSFFGNNNQGHLTNANNNFTLAINRIRLFPFPISKGDFDFSKMVATFQNAVSESYERLAEQNKQLVQRLEDIQNKLLEREEEIRELGIQIHAREKEIEENLTEYVSDFDELKKSIDDAHEEDRKDFSKLIQTDRENFQKSITTDREENKTKFDSLVEKLNIDSKAQVDAIAKKLVEAEKIVGIIGDVGVTGNYKLIANEHKKTANTYRNWAMVFMIMMSLVLGWSLYELSASEFNVYKSLLRILAAAILTYPAIYASRESSKHRELETKNRNLELELAAIGPFIENIPDENKVTIREALVAKYFGNGIEKEKEGDDVSINALEKLLKTILPHVKK